jgi:hypothetical protein
MSRFHPYGRPQQQQVVAPPAPVRHATPAPTLPPGVLFPPFRMR